jgi:FkbM family methyltransferase
MTLKEFLHQLVPPIYWSGTRYLGDKLRAHGLLKVKEADPAMLQRRRALEKAHRAANISCEADEVVIRPGLGLGIHPNSRVAVEPFCYRNPEAVDELDQFRASTAGMSRLLDIGALHGVFSMVFALDNPSGRCLAVDASPIAFSRLLYNLEKNELRSRITPVECAVSDSSGTLVMHYEWEHAVAAPSGDMSRKLKVTKVSGVDLCQKHAFAPDVIKIDVEGHEVKVLKGLRAVFSENRPLVFLEVHPDRVVAEGDPLSFFAKFFDQLGYRGRSVDGKAFNLQALAAGMPVTRLVLSA